MRETELKFCNEILIESLINFKVGVNKYFGSLSILLT